MKEQIKRILTLQKVMFSIVWIAPILIVVLNETGVYQKGIYQGDVQMDYILQSISILLTMGLIIFALRMFNLNLVKRIKNLPLQEALKSYRIWCDVRLSLLFVPIVLDFAFYYLTLNTTSLFCGLMALIATLFCVPTKSRIMNELDLPEDING